MISRRFCGVASASVLLAFVGVSSVRANLITNGQFENPAVPDPSKTYTLSTTAGPNNVTTLQGWTFTNNNTALYGSTYTQSASLGDPSGRFVSTGQLIDLTNVTGNGGVTQSITTVVGQQYALTLVNYNYGVTSAAALPAGAGGAGFSISATGTAAQGYFTPYHQQTTVTYNFTATATSTSISILDRTGTDSNASWIDNVDVEVVPEFAHWAVFAAFGLLVAGGSQLRLSSKRALVVA